ncbi:MAG: cyclic nucleotide-binding domain-containing protein [Thermoanaerobaculia bacterium]
MALKDWLSNMTSAAGKAKSRGSSQSRELSIDDLITLERYDEAREKLKIKVAAKKSDYRARIQLADIYLKMGKTTDAIEEYLAIADRYTSEGFFDKGYALISKLSRRIPHEETLQAKMAAIQRTKRLEHRRQLVVSSLGMKAWAIEVRQHWPDLIRGPIIEVLSREQLQKVFPLLDIRRLAEGQVLVKRNQSLEELFVVLTGEIGAQVQLASGSQTDLRIFHGGDILGERALMKRQPWPALYRAKKATKVLVLNRGGLEQAMLGEEDPRGLLDALRMQDHDSQIAEAASKVKAADPSDEG